MCIRDRGKGSLAYFTAGELIQSESTIAAADPATGALRAEEFSHTKRCLLYTSRCV